MAQTQNNWVTLFSQSTFSHGFLQDLPLRSTSDISRHPHSPGMLASRLGQKADLILPIPQLACILQDVSTLHKCNLTSSYSFSTPQPKYSDLESICVAPTRSFIWMVTVWSSLPEGERIHLNFQIPGGTCRVNNRHMGALLCMYRAARSNWVFNFKG